VNGARVTASIVIAAYRSGDTLPLVLEALAPQVAGRLDREVIVVDSSADGQTRAIARRWPWAEVISLPGRAWPGAARNAGVLYAHGELLAFLDADTVPVHDWIDQLERAVQPCVDMVGGAIVNGRPRSAPAVAAHLLRLIEWTPPRRDALLHAAGGNLLVRRSAFEAAGGFPIDMACAEDTLLTLPAGRRGRLAFAPAAVVYHVKHYSVRRLLAAEYRAGRGHYELCLRCDFPRADAVRRGRLGLALIFRVNGLIRRLVHQRRELGRAVVLSPLISLGLLAWLLGLAAAAGRSRHRALRPSAV